MTPEAPTSGDIDAPRHARFTLRQEELIAAYRRYAYGRWWSRSSLISVVAALLVVAVMIHVLMPDASWRATAGVLAASLTGAVLVPAAMIRWRVPFFARRIYRQQRSLQHEVDFDWDASELRGTTQSGQGRMAWRDFVRWQEDDDIILLYHSDVLFQMIPKRALSAGQIDDLRSLAAAAKVRGAGPRRHG